MVLELLEFHLVGFGACGRARGARGVVRARGVRAVPCRAVPCRAVPLLCTHAKRERTAGTLENTITGCDMSVSSENWAYFVAATDEAHGLGQTGPASDE